MIASTHTRNAVKIVEGGDDGAAFPEDNIPRKPGLKQFQRLNLKQRPLAGERKAVFPVVIGLVKFPAGGVVAIP